MPVPMKKAPLITALLKDLRGALQIDRNNLDEEMIRQPSLYQTVAELFVECISHREFLKEELARIDAEMADIYRKQWEKLGEKTTEAKLGDAVLRSDPHIGAFNAYSEAVKEAGIANALRDSFDQKGKMLKELAQLFVAGYFDKTSVGSGKQARDAALSAAGKEAMSQKRQSSRMYPSEGSNFSRSHK